MWNPAALAASEVLVAGSLVDALVWWQAGFDHTIVAAGPEAVDTLASALTEADMTRVLLAHPRPEGEPLATALAERLGASGVGCFRVVLLVPKDGYVWLVVGW